MKTFTVATFVALAAVATAQLPDVPSCSINCFVGPLTSDGCQDLEDFACHCQKADSLFAAVTPCVQENCTPEEQAEVISKVKDTCAANGVTVTLPDASSTAAPSSTPASSAEATTTTTEAESTSTATETSTSVSAMPTPTGNGTSPTVSPAPTPSEFPGAAARVTQAVGVLGAAALAMLVL